MNRNLDSHSSSWLSKNKENRLLWISILFALAVVIMAVGASMPVDPVEAERIYDELQKELQQIGNVQFIFGNNFMHTLIMFTPFLGPIYGMFIFFNTGTIIAIMAAAYHVSPGLLFVLLFLFPHTWLEFIAYSLALSQSVLLTMAIFKGRFKEELKRTCIIITICALILLLAAVVEMILVSLS